MFKKAVVILLIFIYAIMNFRMLMVYAGYHLNQEFISSSLCENKDIPDSCCKGKCYLDKEVQKADDSNSNQNKNSSNNSKEVLSTHLIIRNQIQDLESKSRLFNIYINHIPSLFEDLRTPPPKVFS